MASTLRFRKHIRTLAHKALLLVLAVSLVFGGWHGTRQRAFAEEADTALRTQASAKPFMDAPSSKPDFPSLTATNWMSGIDNGRYLNEVNIPARTTRAPNTCSKRCRNSWPSASRTPSAKTCSTRTCLKKACASWTFDLTTGISKT